MFFKRSLFVMIGVLLFIGGFLLKFHHTDAQIENGFRQARIQMGVEGAVLTAHQDPVPRPAPATASAPAPAVVSTPAASTNPAPADSDKATPVPGAAPDTNTLIGPMTPPDLGTPDNSTLPGPISPTPDSDTNGTSATPPSTMNVPRLTAGSPFFELAAYDPAGMAMRVAGDETAQATNLPLQKPTATNQAPVSSPATVSTSHAAPVATTPTNAAPISGMTTPAATTNGAPLRPYPVEASVIVLGYHQFTGPGVASRNIYSMSQDVFSSEMKYLHDNGYHVVPLSDVVRFIKHEIGLPPNSVAITIDDGYKSSINFAAPVLKQYGYPWTFFVYPAFITRTEGRGAASWPDLVELQKEGVDIECHSMTHPQLTKHRQMFTETPTPGGGPPTIKYGHSYHELTPQEYDDFLTNETAGAKAILEHELGKTVPFFAYPYGDYNKQVEAKTIAAGFAAIFTVADNPVHETTNVDSIGRYIITKPVERLFASYLRQGALSVAEADPAPGTTITNPRPVITAVLGFSGTLDPKSLETDVRDYGIVRHDFDPKTSTVRLYLPRDLIQSDVRVNIHVRDAQSGQMMVADWHFNYEPANAAAPTHRPISSTPLTNAPAAPKSATASPAVSAASAKNGATPP